MKQESSTQSENSNLVIFPSLVNHPGKAISSRKSDLGNDPLEDLLNEFNAFEKQQDEENKHIAEESIKIFPEDILKREFLQAVSPEAQMALISELGKRIQYYLKEMETFLVKPKK